MKRKLPSLNALRALEAAGRSSSFTIAADELGVTPGAISRQIKLLEESFGLELFERRNGGLTPTDRAQRYTSSLTEIFNRIELVTRQLVSTTPANQLRLSSSITFSLRWLMPRLAPFHRLHPEWDLRFTAAGPPPRLANIEDADVFFQLGDGLDTDLLAEPIVDNDLMPVCAPAYLANAPRLETVEDLRGHTLLHSTLRPGHWSTWMTAMGVRTADPAAGTFVGTSTLAYQAAIEGLGIAIAQVPLVLADLRAGRLVPALPIIVEDTDKFHFMWHPETAGEKVRAIRAFLFAEAEAHRAEVLAATAGFERRPARG